MVLAGAVVTLAGAALFGLAGAAAFGALPDGMDEVGVCAKAGPAIKAVASKPAANVLNIFLLLVVLRQRFKSASLKAVPLWT
jgi:hypothetical protein